MPAAAAARRPARTPKRWRSLRLEPKKRPTQARSRATFDAIVTAAARKLAADGHEALTTNHVAAAAGVGVASVYEYFPGKEAIVAEVVRRMVDRVIARLGAAIPDVLAAPPTQAAPAWIRIIYRTLADERALVAVLVREVPYLRQVPAMQSITPRLMALSRHLRERAGLAIADETETLYLMINLTTSTILQLVLDPPPDVTVDRMLDALAARIAAWV